MKKLNWRDLLRGTLLGLIAGVGYLIAYKIVILFTQDTAWAKAMESLGWLITIPVPAFLLSHFSKHLKHDEPIQPIEPVTDDDGAGDGDVEDGGADEGTDEEEDE